MGKLIIFSAPSGSGKTTIVKKIMLMIPQLAFSVSATTRPIRGTEQNNVDYYFLSVDEFRERINKSEFAEWEEVYENRFYGTLKKEIERLWAKGKHVVFDVDVKGGMNLKKLYKEQALAIFVKAPSIDVLRERLNARNTDTEEDIENRVEKAAYEMAFSDEFDVVVVNNNLDEAVEKTYDLVSDFVM
ncbi:MAG: guanylate kinase [Bacteroidales bacterium]|nr:guanylate kinase [Bacteroidales bacterium]